MMNLNSKKAVQFVQIGSDWFVCVAPIKKGYRLIPCTDSYRANTTAFVNKFLDDAGFNARLVKFKIKRTEMELAGQPLFKIGKSKITKP